MERLLGFLFAASLKVREAGGRSFFGRRCCSSCWLDIGSALRFVVVDDAFYSVRQGLICSSTSGYGGSGWRVGDVVFGMLSLS